MKTPTLYLLWGFLAVAYGSFSSDMTDDFQAIQKEITEFNETDMKELYSMMQEIDSLRKHAAILYRGMTRIYAPVLWNFTKPTDMMIMAEYCKWYFVEDKQFLKDQIEGHVTKPEHKEIIDKVNKGFDRLKTRCTEFFLLHGGFTILDATIIPPELKFILDGLTGWLKPASFAANTFTDYFSQFLNLIGY